MCVLDGINSVSHERCHEIEDMIVEVLRDFAQGKPPAEVYNAIYDMFEKADERAVALYIFGLQVGGNAVMDGRAERASFRDLDKKQKLKSMIDQLFGNVRKSPYSVDPDGEIQ